jgi:hypothetical protein
MACKRSSVRFRLAPPNNLLFLLYFSFFETHHAASECINLHGIKVSLDTLFGEIVSFVSVANIHENGPEFMRIFKGLKLPRGWQFDSALDHHSVTAVTG